VRVAALCLFLLVSACGLGETSPSVVEQTQDGVTALVRNDVQESEDGLVVSDAIERHGFVRRQGSCLVVDYSGQEYSPVFRTPATFDATLQSATAKPSAPLQLLGGPLSKVRKRSKSPTWHWERRCNLSDQAALAMLLISNGACAAWVSTQ